MPIIGTAPSKTYTRSDGTRTGAAVCQQEKTAGLSNTAVLADARENDIATAINMMIMKDGGNQAAANLPMGGYKHTGVAAGSASGEYAEYAQMIAADAAVTAAVAAGYQPLDADLTAISGLTSAANKAIYYTGAGAAALMDATAFGRSLLATSDAAAHRAIATPFPSGTKMLFAQTSAPTGWTKDATHNDKTIRVVSGTASSGGSVALSTASITLTTTHLPAHTHTGTTGTESATHTHGYNTPNTVAGYAAGGSVGVNGGVAGTTGNPSATHTHSFTTDSAGTGSAKTLDLAYVDVIIATKD